MLVQSLRTVLLWSTWWVTNNLERRHFALATRHFVTKSITKWRVGRKMPTFKIFCELCGVVGNSPWFLQHASFAISTEESADSVGAVASSWWVMEQLRCLSKGPFTHAIFDAISRAKRALPYPTRMLFSRSIVWIGKKVITYCLKTPFISISANLVVFCRSVTRLKTCAGLAGAGFVRKIASKSHEKSHV